MPIGIPMGAEDVAGENPMGIVITGLPVKAARMPFRPDWLGEPTGTTRFFCSGYMIASRLCARKVEWRVRVRLAIMDCLVK